MVHDCIVVLGSGVTPDGKLTDIGRWRVQKAVDLWKAGRARHVCFSGAWSYRLPSAPSITEARAMQSHAVLNDIPASAIILEESSKFTLANAYYTKVNVLRPRMWKDIVVVTSEFHVPRTKYIFQKVLGSAYSVRHVAAPSYLNDTEWYMRRQKEGEKLSELKKYLSDVADGDDRAVERFIAQAEIRISESQSFL